MMPREFVRGYLVKGAFIWLMLRLFIAAASQWSASGPTLFGALAVTVVLVLIDAELRRERLFLANLGVGRRAIVGVCLVAVGLVEIAVVALKTVGTLV